jgi:hypothetical protein
MGSPSLTIPAEGSRPGSPDLRVEGLLIAGMGNPVAADYGDYVRRHHAAEGAVTVVEVPAMPAVGRGAPTGLVLFLKPRLTEQDRRTLDDLFAQVRESPPAFLGIVSTLRVHFGDRHALDAESYVLGRAADVNCRTAVFRAGHVLSPRSRATARLRRLGFAYPLVPRRLRGCCVDGDELFAAIEHERRGPRRGGQRVITQLGPNLPWRDRLAEHSARGPWQAGLTAVSALLGLLLLGQLAGLVLALLTRWRPALRAWNFDTLRPGSLRELLALYNPYNYRNVKVVGYNNGVVHFGQRYPGKTVVSTVGCHRVARAGAGVLKADCGATVRRALDFLAGAGQELPVVPNYSYVCLGTSFFVPIHGSAADFSTIADTIVRVVLYDPVRDRMIAAARHEAAFQDHVFNLAAEVLVLRLYLRVKPKSRYYVHREVLTEPTAADLLAALQDRRPANVEIRQAHAASPTVSVSRYYREPGETPSPVLELPRDSLGRLWDRLEENPVTSYLMHALTRHVAWHVELFFTAEEFATFWASHRNLSLRKLQLRYIRRDGMPHSPFRLQDCVSIDLFTFRRHRQRFQAYLKAMFPVVRTNPGKQSW